MRSTLLFVVAGLAAAAQGDQPRFVPLIMGGDPVSGVPDGMAFSHSFGAWLDERGELLLHARAHPPGDRFNWEDFVAAGKPGALKALAVGAAPVPGLPTGTVYESGSTQPFFMVQSDRSGRTFFGARLAGAGSVNTGFFAGTPGAVAPVLLEEQPAPGAGPDVRFLTFNGAAINRVGHVLTRGSLYGPGVHSGNNQGMWFADEGELRLIARNGDPAAGVPGAMWGQVGFEPTLGDSGHVAFRAVAVDGAVREAVWHGQPDSLQVAGLTGAGVPGRAGWTFESHQDLPTINASGQVAFLARITDGSVTREAIVRDGPDGPRTLVMAGAQVPGYESGVSFADFDATGSSGDEPLEFNDRGQAAVMGYLTGPGMGTFGSFALAIVGDADPRIVAREGAQAPGLPEGVVFDDLRAKAFNDLGQLVFEARSDSPDSELWAFDGRRTFRLVREGQEVTLGPGDTRVVSHFAAALGNDASFRKSGLNDAGILTIRLDFTDDSSGVFAVSIPAPRTLGVFAFFLAARRRRG